MSKVTMMGTIACQDGKGDDMEAVLVSMVDAARHEPGLEVYSYHRSDDDTFAFFAVMADAESAQAHGQTEAMREAIASMGPLMAGPPKITMYRPLAAIGFEA
ncbi:MAG: putative quinol monooxygenase [Acidimicrobiales bacterium]